MDRNVQKITTFTQLMLVTTILAQMLARDANCLCLLFVKHLTGFGIIVQIWILHLRGMRNSVVFLHKLQKTSNRSAMQASNIVKDNSEKNEQAAHIDFVGFLKDKPRKCYLTLTPTVFVCLRSQNAGLMADALKRIRDTNVIGIQATAMACQCFGAF